MGELRQSQEFIVLMLKFREGHISDEELQQFNTLLRTNPNVRCIYIELLIMQSIFHGRMIPSDQELLGALAEHEKKAEGVEIEYIPIPEEVHHVVQKTEERVANPLVKKAYALAIISSLAAMIILFFKAPHVPPLSLGLPVGTLSDSIGAQWSQSDYDSLEKGATLVTSDQSMVLSEGFAEFLLNDKTKITIEGPAEIQILTENQFKLNYGRLYAVVAEQSDGLVITTPLAKIVDLGTEFGIDARRRSDTSVYVLKGAAMLITGEQENQKSIPIEKGKAKRVRRESGNILDVPFDRHQFVRDIDSTQNTVWYSKMKFNLADVVSGGSGLEMSSNRTDAIDIASGKMIRNGNREIPGGAETTEYVAVPDLPFVDGVFVPDCGDGPNIISSEGHSFSEFGDSNGKYYIPIGSSYEVFLEYEQSLVPRQLALRGYPAHKSSVICLHANAGITFDLHAIRIQTGYDVEEFRSAYGISWTDGSRSTIASDFFVLIDGQPRMVSRDISEADGSQIVSIALNEDDRFLTLACAEGQENAGDWSLFVNPILLLEL